MDHTAILYHLQVAFDLIPLSEPVIRSHIQNAMDRTRQDLEAAQGAFEHYISSMESLHEDMDPTHS